MKFTIKTCNGIRLRNIWIVKNEYYSSMLWFAVMDEFGTLIRIDTAQIHISLAGGHVE